MLKVENLSKSFNGKLAVDHISFQVEKGEIFGFLGPNGAGKSTTINMICSLLKPDSGLIFIDGIETSSTRPQLRKKLGVVPQDVALYYEISAEENLRFWGELYGMKGSQLGKRIKELLLFFGLDERARDKVKNYSGGMRRRLNLAAGIIHQPELLLLDEPTVGIDPQARHHILDAVKQIAKDGTTILYTTHYMDEAENLCDRLAIIDHGRILTSGSQESITKIVGENRFLKVSGQFTAENAERLPGDIKELTLISLQDKEVVYSLPMKYGTGEFIENLNKSGFIIENLSIKEPSLDSVFIKLTGRELRD
ncbi:ABC transporter ATP-binding protein [candidate division KSB1 bacterium]|nr:ABC transporter ATP-binding protein [candidate division KSB1 bacterium]